MRNFVFTFFLFVVALPVLNAQNTAIYTDLGKAILANDVAKVEQLLKNGANPNEKQDDDSPIGLAIRNENFEICDLIINNSKFKVNAVYTQTETGTGPLIKTTKTAISDAIKSNNAKLVKSLLEKGADVNVVVTMKEISSSTGKVLLLHPETCPLTLACSQKYTPATLEILEMVEPHFTNFKTKYKIHNQYDHESEVISDCILSAQPEFYKSLINIINRGYSVNYSIPLHKSTLDIAKQQKLPEASITALKNYGNTTVLDLAVMAGNKPLIEWLFDNGVKYEKAGDKGATLFTKTKDIEVIKLLVKRGIDINVLQPVSEINILQINIAQMETKDFEELLKMGADPNHKDKFGNTVQASVAKTPFLPKNVKKNIKLIDKYQKKSKK